MAWNNLSSRDFDIPEIQDMKSYNTKAAKQRASLRWLVSIAYDHKPPDDVRDPFYVSGDEQENIKPSVVHALANAELYCLALAHIYADPNYSQLNHWGVIQALARKGVYVAEPSDVALTETTLIQSSPLRMSAHMAVTEAIMTLYIKEVVTGDRIANAVRRLRDVSKSTIGGQSAHDVEEALVIWINQSCSALTQMIADSKVAEGRVEFPGPVELGDLSDGIGICALIACYCPDVFDWSQIAVNDPISVADSLNNLQLMQRFCRESLPYDVCHLTLEDMLYMHGSVKQNVIAFLADLFYLFEVRPAKCVKVPGMAVEKTHEGLRNAGGLRRQGSLQEKDKSNRMSLKEASTVTPGTKVATTQPIARRFQQSSISIELPAKPEESRTPHRPSEQQRQPETEPAEEFVVHKGRNVPTLNAVSRSVKQQQIVFNAVEDDRTNYHAPMAGVPSNWDDRRSSGAGRRSRRNSITEVESHLTIENFGGSQENLSMFARNPDKEQAVHTGRRQMDYDANLSSRSASINYGSGSSSRASDFPEYQATPGSVTRSSSRLQDGDPAGRGAQPSRLSQRSDEADAQDRYRYQDAARGGRDSRFYEELDYVERPRRPESRGQYQQREPDTEYLERPRRPESRGQYQAREPEYEERPRRSESRGPSHGRYEDQRDFAVDDRPRRPESRGATVRYEEYDDRPRRSESRGPMGGRDDQRDYREAEDRSRRVSNYQRDEDYEERPRRPESKGMFVNRQDDQRDFRDFNRSEPQRMREESRDDPKPQPIVIIADSQSIGTNPVDAVTKLSKATNFAELSKLRDNLGGQGLSIVYMQNDSETVQRREKRISVEKERPKSLFVTSQGIDDGSDENPAQAELLSVRLKMEEKRRLIEAEKKKAEVLASKQRQSVGKAAFLQAVSKGRSDRGSPDSGGGESMAEVEYRSAMVSDGTDRLRSMEEMEERDHRWVQEVARSRSCVQTPDYVPEVYNEQFYLHQQAQRRTWGQPQPIPVGYGYAALENQPMGYGQPSPVRRAQWGQPQPVRPMVMQHQYYQQPQPAFSISQPSVYDSPQQELFPVYQAQTRQSMMNAPFRLHDDLGERPQSALNGPRENKNSINHDANRSAFTLPRQGDDSGSRFLPIRRSEERESPVLMRSRHSSTQDVRKERPASATSQGSGGHSLGIHTQLPAPSVDDMEPQSISFIEMPAADDVDSEVPQRIQRLNLSSGSRTYRIPDSGKSPPRPSLSRSFFQAQQSVQREPTSPTQTPERDLDEELANEVKLAKLKEGVDADQGFMITFDDSPKPRRPKPQLGARKNSSTTTTTKSSTPETLASPMTPQKETSTPKRQSLSSASRHKSEIHERSPSPTGSPSLNREVQQITESFQTQVSIPNGGGESRLSVQNGLGFVIDAKEEATDTTTLDDMEKKKEMLLLKSLKRKQEIEEAKRLKELEAQIKKEEEASKEEEKARKREEEKARRAAIFEQYKLKKAIEEAEKEGRTIDMPEPVSARQNVKLRGKPAPAKPRPKTIHVDNSDLGSRSRPGSTTHLTESGSTVKRSEGSKGSNSSLSGSSTARRGSNSSLHADSLPRETGRRIEVHSGRKQTATLGASNNNENDYEGTTARTPVKRAPSPGMGNTMRTRTIQSPSGPGSLPHGLVKQRSNLMMDDNASDAGSTASSEYIGPRLFKQPTAKSNRSIILNAVEYCIFPGAVNRQSKQQVLEEIARSEAKHFLVLFRDAGSQFRSLYEYYPETEEVIKVWGNGPKQVTGNMFDKFFKYNSGGKCFSQVHTKTLTVTIDAFTIHSSLWSGKKTPLPNRKDMSMVI